MQGLRDQLQKAGLINKQQKRQVEQEKRRERKKHRKGQLDEALQAQRQQAYNAKLEAQRQDNQQRAADQRAQQEAKEKRLQIRHLINYWNVPLEPSGHRRWYFTTRHNTIASVYVSDSIAAQLDAGYLAIVECPDESDAPYTLVDREAAKLIAGIDLQFVRFFNDKPADE